MNNHKQVLFILGAGSTAFLDIPPTKNHVDIFKNKIYKADGNLYRLQQIIYGLFGKDNFDMNDVYNIIDNNILLNNGLHYGKYSLSPYDLKRVKQDLIDKIFKVFRKRISKRKSHEYEQLVNFYYELAKLGITNKLSNCANLENRKEFLLDYSIINFNWDLYSIMPIIEAHDKFNHFEHLAIGTNRACDLKIYTDFNCEYASGDEKDKLWYPFTESAAHVVNSNKYDSVRRVFLLKAYYPHGLMNLYKCPSCSKHSLYMGNLTIDSVLKRMKKSKIYKCPYCGTVITHFDFDVLVQSNFKTRNSFLEELNLSIETEIQKADKIIFIGYSLPPDDIDKRVIFKAYCRNKDIYVVLLDNQHLVNEFIPSNQVISDKPEIKHFKDVFEKQNHLYFNLAGFPSAIDPILKIVEE